MSVVGMTELDMPATPDRVLFASQLKAFRAAPDWKPTIDDDAVAEFNAGKEFKGVVPIVADRPLMGNPILQQLGDPKQFLEFAYRSLQLATLPF